MDHSAIKPGSTKPLAIRVGLLSRSGLVGLGISALIVGLSFFAPHRGAGLPTENSPHVTVPQTLQASLGTLPTHPHLFGRPANPPNSQVYGKALTVGDSDSTGSDDSWQDDDADDPDFDDLAR